MKFFPSFSQTARGDGGPLHHFWWYGSQAAVNAPHSKRFAQFESIQQSRQRLECGSFSAAFPGFTGKGRPIARFMAICAILLAAISVKAGTTNGLSYAEIQGRKLAGRICERLAERPAETVTNVGTLIIDGPNGRSSKTPVQLRTTVGAASWSTIFETTAGSNRVALVVIHKAGEPNRYEFYHGLPQTAHSPEILSGNKTMVPFAGSDFWVADLGLVFFHWPEQKILKHYEMRRGRSCHVLESDNPDPSPHSYARVVSWIDNETLGIVQAEAYDAKGKLLKEFYPKDFKKVNGRWEMGEMEMINDQTDSRTWIKFNLKKRARG